METPLLEEAIRKRTIKLLVLDSDGVTVPRGTKIYEYEDGGFYSVSFQTNIIDKVLAEKINKLKKKIAVCISSGRNLVYLQSMYSPIVGGNTIFQAENGCLTMIGGKLVQYFDFNKDYFELLAAIKNRLKSFSLVNFEPKQFILTAHADKEYKEVYETAKEFDFSNELKVMWNGEAFDIMRKDISKGEALKRLIQDFGIKKDEVIAIGDRINDKELLEVAGIGISADKEKLPAEYYIEDQIPARVLVDLLLKIYYGENG